MNDGDETRPARRRRSRRSIYDPAIEELVTDYCMLGATNDELAELLKVGTSTIEDWLKVEPTFAAAAQKGRVVADGKVAHALYRRAIGYSHPDTHIAVIRTGGGRDADGNQLPAEAEVIVTPIVKHYPPDTNAALAWLSTRQRKKWQPIKDIEPAKSPEELAQEARNAIAAALRTVGGAEE